MAGVIKHIPGHGGTITDSHKKMPIVSASLKKLNHLDFYAFKDLNAQFAMTAHILYKKIDNRNVATFSKKIIKEVIRKNIGFKGILISDDISMKALKHDISKNTKKAFTAGCNLVLHCNGNLNEMRKVAIYSPLVSNFIIKKTSQLLKKLS